MLLTGTYPRTLDDKLRFAMPKRVRDSLGERPVVYLAPGTDGSLSVFPEAAFERLAEQVGQHSPAGQDVRAFSRLFFAQAVAVELDGQGRVRIPTELAAIAGLKKEVVLLGVRDHLEIWDQFRWEGYVAAKQPHYDEIAEGALDRRSAASVMMPSPSGELVANESVSSELRPIPR